MDCLPWTRICALLMAVGGLACGPGAATSGGADETTGADTTGSTVTSTSTATSVADTGGACQMPPPASECEDCLQQQCCAELQACVQDPVCSCQVGCILANDDPFDQIPCALDCGALTGDWESLGACIGSSCSLCIDPGGDTDAMPEECPDTRGGPRCDPDAGLGYSWSLEGVDIPEEFDTPCNVAQVDIDPGPPFLVTIALDCGNEQRSIYLSLDPSTPVSAVTIAAGMPVLFSYSELWDLEVPDRWLRIQDDGGELLLGAVDSENLALDFAAPLTVTVSSQNSCPSMRVWDDCVVAERVGLEVSDGVESTVVFEGNADVLDGTPRYEVFVDRATRATCYETWDVCGFNYAPTRYDGIVLGAPP